MQTQFNIHITPAEWRWVILFASLLVLLAFLPFLWVAVSNTRDWQFMGALHNYQDGATYISKMVQGMEGYWLIRFQHSPDPMNRVLLQVIYPLLGHVARLTSLPPIVMFHVARVGAALFMYITLYQLAASIWMRLRTRRIFFIIASVGAGFGWLVGPLTGSTDFPDLTIPEAFPLYSTFVNVHFPLTIGCLALLVSLMITFFRPGAEQDSTLNNSALLAGILSLVVALLYPQALVPLLGALGLYLLISWVQRRQSLRRSAGWAVVFALPALFAAYYTAIVTYNPAIAEWSQQNVTAAPPPLALVLGFGLPLVLALPALIRAVRRFEQDDDRIMLLWLLVMLVVIYLPTTIQRRFAVAMMLPIAYFATRSLEEFWFRYINRRQRPLFFLVVLPLMAISQVFVLFAPVLLVFGNRPDPDMLPQEAVGVFLERDYAFAFNWLRDEANMDTVILASPKVSAWVPGWTGARVVYGHPYETLNADAREQAVLDWYDGDSPAECSDLLERYNVGYVLMGPEEVLLGQTECLDTLERVEQFGLVSVYAP